MKNPKVSIITPCYNGELHLKYFLDSLLNQDYSNVEFFFVDDGSNDKTKEIFETYVPKLEEKGWTVKYIYKKNGGAASAINKALSLITGKYFIWPDSDDILYSNHISQKVKFMEAHPDYGMGYAPSDVVEFENLDKIIGVYDYSPVEDMFNHVLKERKHIWTLGTIARVDALFDTIPDKKIYEGQAGQNCQIQMPILQKYPTGRMEEHLAKRVIRKNSHYITTSKKFFSRRINMMLTWVMTILKLKYITNYEKLKYTYFVLKKNIGLIYEHYCSKIFWIQIRNGKLKLTVFGIKISIKIHK